MSFEVINLSLVNKAKADTIWFADEASGTQVCHVRVRAENTSELVVGGLSLKVTEKWLIYEGTKGACEDASIWYACRRVCTANPGAKVVSVGA